jgi:hypothetical protein
MNARIMTERETLADIGQHPCPNWESPMSPGARACKWKMRQWMKCKENWYFEKLNCVKRSIIYILLKHWIFSPVL